jgi:ribonucleoside-diphosphate reductase alpha chain
MQNFQNFVKTGVLSSPCVSGGTLLLTGEGYRPIAKLVGQETEIWNGYEWSNVMPEVMGHHQRMVRITFSDGTFLDCTKNHPFLLTNECRATAERLIIGDRLAKWDFPVIYAGSYDEDYDSYTAGFYSGSSLQDGRCTILKGTKKDVAPFLRLSSLQYRTTNIAIVFPERMKSQSYVPFAGNVLYRVEWLAGFLDAAGTESANTKALLVYHKEQDFLNNVRLLLSTLGCHSTLKIAREYNNGQDTVYVLSINGWNLGKLLDRGMETFRINVDSLVAGHDTSRYVQIVSVQDIKAEENVYGIEEIKNHSVIFNGILAGTD